MFNPFFLLFIGFLSWWGTGIDDVLALSLLMKRLGPTSRRFIILGNIIGVILILLLASLSILGIMSISPTLLQTKLWGIQIKHLAGFIPIFIGLRSLYLNFTQKGKEESNTIAKPTFSDIAKIAFLGFQIYILNSTDDFSVHIGILSGVVKQPITFQSFIPISFYIGGVLLGEVTSILSAHWLTKRMETVHVLELLASISIIIVGTLVLLGVF
jgi:cadmium resistance protein CadD (predicted permease)